MKFTAAAVQLTSTGNLNENLAIVTELVAEAAGRGAKLVSLPECFAFLGPRERDKFPVTENLDADSRGPILTAVRQLAIRHSMWLSAGGIAERIQAERDAPADQLTTAYNTHIVVSPTGDIVAKYRKIHLFDVDIPGRATLKESENTAAGTVPVTADTELGVLGLSVCYDLRFPELYRTLALRMNASVLLVPSAFTIHTGAAHWHTLLRARAIENQAFVVAAGQIGQHNSKRASYGHSLIIDPWGVILAEVGDGTGLAIAQLDMEKLAETRRNMPCAAHQRLSFT